MLEFQEGFFDQEVRDGFYLDTTMKTLWAAELEVLQKVAEVCDRHGLKWYAAYGTLLGAIRHEGFVPWDDDMDIWVKRADYNILMQVLPKELPEGYLVRGPLTDEGYDQYHTCLNSGNGISIAKEWLEQYHGCPFTVGLDIFPLDYLPRNEKDRDLQVQLLTMTGRIAQLAKNLSRGDYDTKEDETEVSEGEEDNREKEESIDSSKTGDKQEKATTLKEEIIEEINLGIDYLEENCKLQVDHQLLEDENWGSLSSEIWKWANYLAMMYSEEESDYLVEFFDYIQCPRKKYPKDWFGDGYSATFENFMIPIPSGYEDILRHIYGHYMVCSRGGGTHEYPYYARQLRQLREYVKDIEQRAQKVGWLSIDEIEVEEESRELPEEWTALTLNENGLPKKIVLSANDPDIYIRYGNKALDKLEKNLRAFEKAKDIITFWWRPQPVMEKVLAQVSPDLCERYKQILDSYKAAGWGICDETDNVERAVSACDIYYGDLNAIIQPFQNANKSVMVNVVDGEGGIEEFIHDNNAGSKREFRVFISTSDYVEDEGHIYLANTNYNALVVVDKATQLIVKHIPFAETRHVVKNMHLQSVRLHNKIYFLPAEVPYIHIYDVESGTQKACHFLEETDAPKESWGYFLYGEKVFLLPCKAALNLWSIRPSSDVPTCESWWGIPDEEAVLKHGKMDENCFYTLAESSDRLYITNVRTKKVKFFSLPDDQIKNIVYDGMDFWYTLNGTLDIVCWNQDKGIVDRFCMSQYIYQGYFNVVYAGICFAAGNLFLVSADREFLYVLEKEKRQLKILYCIEEYKQWRGDCEFVPYFKQVGNLLICIYRNTDIVLLIDLQTLKVERWNKSVGTEASIEEDVQKYIYKVLLEETTYKSVLLFEDNRGCNIDLLIQYCSEKSICAN